jgi:hypothetical protein
MDRSAPDMQVYATDGGEPGKFFGEILSFEDHVITHNAAFPTALILGMFSHPGKSF